MSSGDWQQEIFHPACKINNHSKYQKCFNKKVNQILFSQAYKINNFGSCPKKEHKNNEHNPWCLHGLGQEMWFESNNGPGEDEEDHFSVRPKYLGRYSGLRNLGESQQNIWGDIQELGI